jgi:hypothetical protein
MEENRVDEFPCVDFVELFPCDPNPYYTSKAEMEKKCKLKLPNFVVKECKESLKKTDGRFMGEATIEFNCFMDEKAVNLLKSEAKQLGIRWRKWLPGEYLIPIIVPRERENGELWHLIIKKDTNQGLIRYRNPYNQ